MLGKLLGSASRLAMRTWERAFPKAVSTAEHAAEGAARNAGRAGNANSGARGAAEGAERARVQGGVGSRTAQNDAGKKFIAQDNLSALSVGKHENLLSFNRRADQAFDELRANGMIVDNGRMARAMTPEKAQQALRAGRPINEASAEALEAHLRGRYVRASTAEHAVADASVAGRRGAGQAAGHANNMPMGPKSEIIRAVIEAVPAPLRKIVTWGIGGFAATALGANALSLTPWVKPEEWGTAPRMFINATDGLALGGDYDKHLSRVAEFIFNRMTTDTEYLQEKIRDNLNINLPTITRDGKTIISPEALADPQTRENLVRALNNATIPDVDLRQALGVYLAVQLGRPPETTPRQLLEELTSLDQAQGAKNVADVESAARQAAASGDVNAITNGVTPPSESANNQTSSDLSKTWFQVARDATQEQYSLLFARSSPHSSSLETIFKEATGNDGLQANEISTLKDRINASNLPNEVKTAAGQAFGYQP